MTSKVVLSEKEIKAGTTEIIIPESSGTTVQTIGLVVGAFGDMDECEGLLERVITPPEGGTFMKFVGCSYLFKGFPMNQFVENLGLAKALISFLPRVIILKSFLFTTSFILLFFFARRRLIHYLNLFIGMIYDRTVIRTHMNEKRYNPFTKELRRATELVLNKEYIVKKSLIDYSAIEMKDNEGNFNVRNLELSVLMAKITYLIYFFLEHDNAYRFRVQDILELVNKENVRKNIVAEIDRLFRVLIEREHPSYGERAKWIALRRIAINFLRFNSMARRIVKNILLEIDIEKVKLDEADWYFCLRRKTYSFRGVPLELRLREKVLIDKEKGHTIPKFIYKNQ